MGFYTTQGEFIEDNSDNDDIIEHLKKKKERKLKTTNENFEVTSIKSMVFNPTNPTELPVFVQDSLPNHGYIGNGECTHCSINTSRDTITCRCKNSKGDNIESTLKDKCIDQYSKTKTPWAMKIVYGKKNYQWFECTHLKDKDAQNYEHCNNCKILQGSKGRQYIQCNCAGKNTTSDQVCPEIKQLYCKNCIDVKNGKLVCRNKRWSDE